MPKPWSKNCFFMIFKVLLCQIFAINFVDIASCFQFSGNPGWQAFCVALCRQVTWSSFSRGTRLERRVWELCPVYHRSAEIFPPRTKRLSLCLSDGGCTREKTRWNFGRRLKSSVALPRCGVKKNTSSADHGVKKVWSVADREQCYAVTHRNVEETNMTVPYSDQTANWGRRELLGGSGACPPPRNFEL